LALPLYGLILIGSLVGYWKGLQAQRQPPMMGTRAMIGNRAMVISAKKGEIEVDYRGEIWRAVSPQVVHRGQQVIIEDVEGLTLRVTPLPQPAEDERPGQRG